MQTDRHTVYVHCIFCFVCKQTHYTTTAECFFSTTTMDDNDGYRNSDGALQLDTHTVYKGDGWLAYIFFPIKIYTVYVCLPTLKIVFFSLFKFTKKQQKTATIQKKIWKTHFVVVWVPKFVNLLKKFTFLKF